MHYFSNLFWYRTLHVSDRFTVHHQEYGTVYTVIGISHTDYANCLVAGSGCSILLISLAVSIICMTNTYCCVYSNILVMMDAKPVRNM